MEVSESKITELFIYSLYVQGNAIIFFDRGCVAWFVFLANCQSERKST